jgi:hypothetical protein
VWSPLLPINVRGIKFDGLTHITDWFQTILSLAGIDPFSDKNTKQKRLDGFDLSNLLLGETDDIQRRQELVHNLDVNVDGTLYRCTCSSSKSEQGRHWMFGRMPPWRYESATSSFFMSSMPIGTDWVILPTTTSVMIDGMHQWTVRREPFILSGYVGYVQSIGCTNLFRICA